MSKKRKQNQKKPIYCNPDICENCQYIGEGDSFCDVIHEIVLSDWMPTEHYMGKGCRYGKER